MLDQQAAHPQLDPIALVGLDPTFPERLGDDSEHRPTVEALAAGLDRMHRQAAERAALDERPGKCHAVVSRLTGWGIALGRRREARTLRAPRSRSRSVQRSMPRSRASRSSRISTWAVATASPAARWRAAMSMP